MSEMRNRIARAICLIENDGGTACRDECRLRADGMACMGDEKAVAVLAVMRALIDDALKGAAA